MCSVIRFAAATRLWIRHPSVMWANRTFVQFGVVLATTSLILTVAGCSTPETEYAERPVEEIYNEAIDALGEGDLQTAVREFDEVERQHPYSVWATKSQLMSAFVLYESGRYDEAIIALDHFIDLHPGNPKDASYAYYMKALSYYEQIQDVSRDQNKTVQANDALEAVVRRYPKTGYARDASVKLDLVRDHLAGKEMEVGRFYLERGHYLAAINRFRTVVEKYQTTSHVAEALHRLTEAYTALGVTTEARENAAVLGHNFPGSKWYIDSYKTVEGVDIDGDKDGEIRWFNRLWPF